MILKCAQKIIDARTASMKGSLLNNLTDQFRADRDPWDLLVLINSFEKKYLNIAIYILGEITINDQALEKMIVNRLRELLDYDDFHIRHSVLLLLSELLINQNMGEEKDVYLKMMKDQHEIIREDAKTLMSNNGRLY